jgi:rod shape-determining protein MreB
MLRYFIGKTLGKFNLFKPDVMVSVPAGITSTERRAVVEAAVRAGAKNAYVVKEPILAAIGAGIPIHESKGHMIMDIGGGTTDVAVISLGGIVASTSVKCAGDKIDQAIADYIKKTFNLAIGDKTSEIIKIKIGAAVPLEEELTITIKGRDFIQGLPRTAQISTNEVVRAIDKELRTMISAIKDVLAETPPEIAADIIDDGIIMTGGSSQLRNLADLIYRRTGVKARVADDPLLCVVKGTGEALHHLDTYKKTILSKK